MEDDEFEELVGRCDRLLEGRILYTREDEHGNALRGTVDAVYEGDDADAFERHAEDAIFDLGWTFVGTERVEWFVPNTERARRLALAISALSDGAIALGTSYEWPDEPETIDPEETAALEDAVASQRLVYAVTEYDAILGFVVAFSDEVVLVHNVDRVAITVNGYTAIRRRDFLSLRSLEDESDIEEGKTHFFHEGVRLAGVVPTDPGADLTDVPSFLRWAGRLGIVAVLDRDDPDGRFVGAVGSVDDELLVLRGIDRTGAWRDDDERRIDNIVVVDVLGAYLRALERVAGPRPDG